MKTGRNLQEVLVELDRQNKAKQDFISPAQGMRLREDGHTFELNHLTTDRQMTFGTTSLFHRQVASALGIPAKYYDLMQSQKPELLAENVNAWFADRTSSYMVRSMDYGSGQVARALLSERYANVSDIKNLLGDELVASAIKSAMSEMGPEEVTNRTKVEPLAQQKLGESLIQKYGEGAVYINKVVINDMDFEEAYNAAIQQKSIAQQNAAKQKIENEAAIAKAEADKQVAITNAEAEAQKTSIAADAQAEANRKIAESLSEPLIEYQKIQKWDGKLPTVSGGNALVSIDPAE